jgi:probable rRNA maturation factor
MPRAAQEAPPADWLANRQRAVRLDRHGMERFAAQLRRRLAGGREFGVCIASDEALRRANLRFRGKNCDTDVLSFPGDDSLYLGDILISAQRARRQARRLGHSVEEELQILLLHGLLHLLGHDHERDHGRMQRLEQSWRRRLSLPAGLL